MTTLTQNQWRIRRHRARGLKRFLDAQEAYGYDAIKEELRRGSKAGHWIWFVFPQAPGLGNSYNSQAYALTPRQARRYLKHPILGPRLRDCTELVASWLRTGLSLERIMGSEVDAMKFESCMDLFSFDSQFAAARHAIYLIKS